MDSTLARIVSIFSVLALLISSLSIPAAALDKEVKTQVVGEVTVGAAQPSVNFTFYSDPAYSTPTKEFTPQTPVYMKIGVSTDNQLRDVVITVKLFADNTSDTAVGNPPSSTSPETYVYFTISFDPNTGDWILATDENTSTSTWSIQLDTSKQLPDPTSISGWFYVIIVPGKTAREASTTEKAPYKDWDVIVEASTTDTAGNTQTGVASDYGYTMYFYGEASTDVTTVDFGVVQPRSSSLIKTVTLSDGSQLSQDYFTVNVVANGHYNLTLTAATTWSSSDSTAEITLTTGTPGLGEFKLEASTQKDSTTGALVNPVVVAGSQSASGDVVTLAQPTSESGVTYNIFLNITLGYGIHVDKYSGAIYVIAEDAQ